jgi:hypothetical protein
MPRSSSVTAPSLFAGAGWESLVNRSERAYATLSGEERVWLNVGYLIIATESRWPAPVRWR